MKYLHLFALIVIGHIPFFLRAQGDIPIGTWRTHFNFRDNHSVAVTEQKVYSAGNNTLFYFDLQDRSLNQISKIDGLSSMKISDISYHVPSETLVIGYNNGIIDLLHESEIKVINDLNLAMPQSEIIINDMVFLNDLAYLSSNIGVIVLDITREEIREVYSNIGPDATPVAVNAGAIMNDSLFIATDQGVMAGSLTPAVNLLDFNNWRRFDISQGIPDTDIAAIQFFNDRLWAAIDFNGIYHYNGQSWQQFNLALDTSVKCLTSNPNELMLTTGQNLIAISPDNDPEVISHPLFINAQCAERTAGVLWVADSVNGLITDLDNGLMSLFPSGPFSDSLEQVRLLGEKIAALPPGYDRFRRPLNTLLGFNLFDMGSWVNYNGSGAERTTKFPAIPDLVDVTRAGNFLYFASFGAGLVQWDGEESVIILDHETPGSTFIRSSQPGDPKVLISGVKSDPQGNIWTLNYGNPSPLHRFKPLENQWAAFSSSFGAARFPIDLDLSESGDFWITLDPNNGGGILITNPENGQERWLTNDPGEGGLPGNRVLDVAIDLEGQVWVATDQGLGLFPFPFDLLSRPQVDAQTIFIDGRPLLRDQVITSLAIDGGNRKWVGTENGLWLFSEFGDSVIHNFTEDNSPLPDDHIIDVEIHQVTGEVFIVTRSGMVSFRGEATLGTVRHQQVKIFPNPVTRDFSGTVGISGLTSNSIVKITDITGKLVSELRAQGGTATWNVADLMGTRVKSGVYLIFSSNSDGDETFVGKIAVFN